MQEYYILNKIRYLIKNQKMLTGIERNDIYVYEVVFEYEIDKREQRDEKRSDNVVIA